MKTLPWLALVMGLLLGLLAYLIECHPETLDSVMHAPNGWHR